MNEALDELQSQIQICTKCSLNLSRKRAVLGEGNEKAKIMLVGQCPGDQENEIGRPFVGPAGVLLGRLISNIKLKRRDLWLTNVVRCIPPGRLPHSSEIKTCAPFLLEEIKIIKPKIVCPLGNIALSLLLRKPAQIHQFRGKPIPAHSYFIFPALHPAAALRQSNFMPQVEEDFRNLKAFIDSNPVLEPPPGQESLF